MNPELYKQAFLEITAQFQNYVKIFTDGSKVDKKFAAAAVSFVASNSPVLCRPIDHCPVYTAELLALLFALKQAYQSQGSKFQIFSDSLSALQALGRLKTVHSLLIQIQDLLHKITAKYMYLVWQKERDEAAIVSNMVHEIYQSFRTNCYHFVRQGKETQF